MSSLITALQHADLTIRRAAAATLSLIGPEARAALPSLRQLERDPDELLRVWVRAALKAIGVAAYLNAGIAVGSPTRMKKRANACERCSRYGGSKRRRGP